MAGRIWISQPPTVWWDGSWSEGSTACTSRERQGKGCICAPRNTGISCGRRFEPPAAYRSWPAVGALTTGEAVALSRQAVDAGATAVAAIPPCYDALTRGEILHYYTAVGQAAEPLPLYLYNIPSHARNDLTPALVKEIRQAVPTVAGIKDSSGFPGRIADLVKTMGPGFDVVCGNDEKDLGAFQDGAAGIVSSGAGIFPELYLELHAAWKAGRLAEAQAAQARIAAMQEALGDGARLGWYKYVLAERGIPVGGVRAPLLDPSPAHQEAIRKRLKGLKLL
jgi:4-hydroxy-tetrahydrodipicolinate synthase